MRDLSELNINEGGVPVARTAPDESVIAEFEREFGVVVPGELLALLRHSNGGHPELDAFLPENGDPTDAWAVDRFHHLTDDKESTGGMWANARVWRPVLGVHALPFATTGGGDEFFLDLSQAPAPVCVSIHDENYRVVVLAPSLKAFLDQLMIDPDYI